MKAKKRSRLITYNSVLSEEDCKTIGWVDVEKLFIEKSNIPYFPSDLKETCNWWFKEGFKTAQSLNDKMFSLEDMRKAILMGRIRVDIISPRYSFDEIIQSLQQTEWDVEVNELNQITKIK